MKLKVSLEYSDKTSAIVKNEPKKLSLGHAIVKQKNWRLHNYASGESPVQTVLNLDRN